MRSQITGAAFLASLLSSTSFAAYTLKDDYTSGDTSFFDMFSYWTSDDPTHGFVDFLSQADASSAGLIKQDGSGAFIGVDNTTVLGSDARGRSSLRMTSNAGYQHGTLFVADLAHMPGISKSEGLCGVWPAFWTVSSATNWPAEGEIDIVEEITTSNTNQMSLHVSSQNGTCNIASGPSMNADKDRWPDCTEEGEGGCDANDSSDASFGGGFNDNKGGVYAMEWTSDYIRVYFFPRESVPSDDSGPLGTAPDPSKWGTPATSFEGGDCNLDDHVANQHIVIDTTFCGDWAGNDKGAWTGYTQCSSSTGFDQCSDYVAQKPEAFDDAYWLFNSLKVYTSS